MLDAHIRPLIDPPLNWMAVRLNSAGVRANQITVLGFVFGLSMTPAILLGWYELALALLAINRLCDGLDGAVARHQEPTDFGAYLDIVVDFIFYSSVVFAFSIALPEQALYGAFLIFSFVGSGSAFLAFAILAEKRGIETSHQGEKSFFYLAGIAEGFETIVALALMCLWPDYFWLIALAFGTLCWVSVIGRIITAQQQLK